MIEWNKLRKMLKELAVISIGNAQKIYPLIDQMEAEGNKLQELSELDTASSLAILERIGESEAQRKLNAGLKIIEEWCSDCLKPKYTCASCVYQLTKEELGFRPRLSRGETAINSKGKRITQ